MITIAAIITRRTAAPHSGLTHGDGRVTRPRKLFVRPELAAFVALVVISAITYFPATQITVEGNDTLDSFLPTNAMAPPVWETFLKFNAEAPTLNGLSMNMLAFSELDFTRVIFSIFPRYAELSWFYFLNVLALFISFAVAMHAIGTALDRAKWAPAPDGAAVAIGALIVALLPHNSVMLAPLVACNLFAAALGLIFARRPAWIVLSLLALSAFFGDISSGSYLYIGLFFVFALALGAQRGNWRPAFYAVAAVAFTLIADYRTLLGLLFAEPSHRSTWLDDASSAVQIANPVAWSVALSETNALIFGRPVHYHYQWNTRLLPMIAAAIGVIGFLVLALVNNLTARPSSSFGASRSFAVAATAAGICALVALAYGVLNTGMIPVQVWLQLTLQVERIITILPFLASTVVVFSLSPLMRAVRIGLVKAVVATTAAAAIAIYIHDPLIRKIANLQHFARAGANNPFITNYTVGTYYQRGAFNALKQLLGPEWVKERVISIGNDPMIADYNGFRHLDGYYFQYPKAYQLAFRSVVAPNLSRLPDKGALYDGWGNRFGVSVIQTIDGKADAPIDGCAFARLGGTLVISWKELLDPHGSDLVSEGSVEAVTEGLSSTLYLYRPTKSCGTETTAAAGG